MTKKKRPEHIDCTSPDAKNLLRNILLLLLFSGLAVGCCGAVLTQEIIKFLENVSTDIQSLEGPALLFVLTIFAVAIIAIVKEVRNNN